MRKDIEVKIEIKEIFKIIRKRLNIMILIMIPAVALSLHFGLKKVPPLYEAKSSVIVGNPLNKEGTQFRIEDVFNIQSFMKTYSKIAVTTDVTEKTINKLNLPISSEGLQSCIIAIPEEDTQFMDLKIRWTNSKQAVEILNTLTDVFIQEAKNIYPTINIQVMEKAKDAYNINTSNKKMYTILGPIGGIIFSVLVIFGIEFMDNTLKTEEDIEEYLQIPVIGEIPKEKIKIKKINLDTLENMKGYTIEAYRSLRTNLYFTSAYKNVKSIVVTSGKPGEGKTTNASMISIIMAKGGKKTILIDCDLRKSNVHKIFDLPNILGLSNMLVGEVKWKDIVHKSDIENLYILTAGIKPPNPSELLSFTKMREIIEELKNNFDYIIMDTPPVGAVADAQVLAKFTDGCMLVVSSGESDIKETVKAKSLIQQVDGRILGVSLNKVKDKESYNYYNDYNENNNKKRRREKKNIFGLSVKKIKSNVY